MTERKKPLTEEELDEVSGGSQPGPPNRQRGLGDPGIKVGMGDPGLVNPPDPDLPPGPCKLGH
jgi:bacteriocin-like protein